MGIFIIVTASWCGPCSIFKERLMKKFVNFLYDNVTNIKIIWYEVSRDRANKYALTCKYNEGCKTGEKDDFDIDEIEGYINFFPQGIYKPINGDIYPNPIEVLNENKWNDILDIINDNPDTFAVMTDGVSPRRSSPRRRTSPRRRAISPRKGRRWIDFK